MQTQTVTTTMPSGLTTTAIYQGEGGAASFYLGTLAGPWAELERMAEAGHGVEEADLPFVWETIDERQ